jgi:O-antigen ligase/tetratricopeptide (TPR) repeat protein
MKKALELIALSALFIIPFLPLYVEPSFFFPFITGKGFAFRILVEIAAFATLALAFMDKDYRPRFSWTGALLTLLVAWMFVADLFGINPHKAFWSNFERMDGWVTLIHLLLLFVTTSVLFKQEEKKHSVPSIITWGGAILFCFALFANFAVTQAYAGMIGKFLLLDIPIAIAMFAMFVVIARAIGKTQNLWHSWWLVYLAGSVLTIIFAYFQINGYFSINQGGVRVDATLGNAIYFAVYLLFGFFIAIWQSLIHNGWLRRVLLLLAGLQALFLIFTATRGAFVALIVGSAVAVGYYFVKHRRRIMEHHKNTVIALLVVLAVLVGGFFALRDNPVVQSNPILGRLSSISLHDLTTRSTLWGIALQGASEQPITGWGQDGFNHVFNKYYNPSLYLQESWFDRVHNTYLDYLVAGGVPAFLLFITLLFAAMYAVVRHTENTEEKILLLAALVAYAVQAITVFDNLFSYVPFVMILAMAHSRSSRPITKLNTLPEVKSKDVQTVTLIVITIVGLTTLWIVNISNALASAKLINAIRPQQNGPAQNLANFKELLASNPFAIQEVSEHFVMFAVDANRMQGADETLKQEVLQTALAAIDAEIAKAKGDSRLQLQKLAIYSSVGNIPEALKVADAALEKSPKKQAILIEKGNLHWRMGDYVNADRTYKEAYMLDTQFDATLLYAAIGDILTGRVAEGKQALTERFGTYAVDNDPLLLAFYQADDKQAMLEILKGRVDTREAGSDAQLQAKFQYILVLAETGQKELARSEARKIGEERPDLSGLVEQLLTQIDVTTK